MAFTKIVGAGIHTLSNVHTHNINSSGIITATNFVGIFSGTNGDFSGDVTIDGNLTVNGTTTTLDTVLTEVDKLEVAANNSTVGAAITQSGSGDILNLYDGSTEVLTVKDGGKIGINTTDTGHLITVLAQSASTVIARFKAVNKNSNFDISTDVSSHGSATVRNNIGAAKVKLNSNGASYFTGGNVGIGTDNPQSLLSLHQSGGGFEVNANSGSNNARLLSYDRPAGAYREMSFQALSYGFDTNGAERFRITSAGKVGIGEDSPDELLHIASTGTAKFRLTDNRTSISDGSQYGVIQFEQRDANTPGVSLEMAALMTDTTNGATALQIKTGTPSTITERFRISSEGKCLIERSVTSTSGVHPALQIETTTNGSSNSSFATGIDFFQNGIHKKRLGISKGNAGTGGGDWAFYKDQGNNVHTYMFADGDMSIVDGNLKLASGHGIDFSATSHATGKTSEKFDDYEEGTWTPYFSTQSGSDYTISSSYNYYIKIGKIVHAHFGYTFTAVGSGSITLMNLPFAADSSEAFVGQGYVTSNNNRKSIQFVKYTANIVLPRLDDGQNFINYWTPSGSWSATNSFVCSITYKVP